MPAARAAGVDDETIERVLFAGLVIEDSFCEWAAADVAQAHEEDAGWLVRIQFEGVAEIGGQVGHGGV